ncbi:MAG: nuclear transport factor 2 family protein [Caulobacterales bacterium]|nr:nuclear transport factor 2 family protein [Caulobacterales bacterium]
MSATLPVGLVSLILLVTPAESEPTAPTQIAASFDALDAAATRLDTEAYLGRLDPDLIWIGNDLSERWTYEAFEGFVRPYFEHGEGWTYSSRERRIVMSPDPCECLAWVDQVLDSQTYGTAVSTAVVRRSDEGDWRIWRNALTYPIPNDLAREMTGEIRAWEAANPQPEGPLDHRPSPAVADISLTLDRLHQAAAHADGATYFSLFTADALYRGTDATELWTLDEFRAFAEPYFSRGRGWTYAPRERHVSIAPTDCACVAWFDEILDSESYGTSRGTGVLVRGDEGVWKIAYYALTFPIPNALARDMTARIRAAEPDGGQP